MVPRVSPESFSKSIPCGSGSAPAVARNHTRHTRATYKKNVLPGQGLYCTVLIEIFYFLKINPVRRPFADGWSHGFPQGLAQNVSHAVPDQFLP